MDRKTFEQYKAYFDKVTPVLIQAEEIRSSEEWKRAYNYFHVLYNRGYLKENPNHKNGYKIELRGQAVEIADLADILTPEQMEKIRSRAFDIIGG